MPTDDSSTASELSPPGCETGLHAAPVRTANQSFRFLKQQHLRSSREFSAVYEAKFRASDYRLLAFGGRNGLGYTRIGLSVSRKQGGAVHRQRLKRLLREAFRLEQYQIPSGLDLILIPKVGIDSTVAQLRDSLVRLARQLQRKLPPVSDTESVVPPTRPLEAEADKLPAIAPAGDSHAAGDLCPAGDS